MIRYDLICEFDHEFEGWFSSSADYDEQEKSGLLCCSILRDEFCRKSDYGACGQNSPKDRIPRGRGGQSYVGYGGENSN